MDILRAKFIEECEALLERWPNRFSESERERFDRFFTGECSTLPVTYDFEVAFLKVLREFGRPYRDDQRWIEAKSELQKYFFLQSFWID